jgi:hypothetical protein
VKHEELDDDDIPKITNAEITDDGAIIVKFDRNVVKGKKKAVFLPETLFDLAQEYGEIETEGDFAGLPFVYSESILAADEDGGEGEAVEKPSGEALAEVDGEADEIADEIFGPEADSEPDASDDAGKAKETE